jgi:hypothetical protein
MDGLSEIVRAVCRVNLAVSLIGGMLLISCSKDKHYEVYTSRQITLSEIVIDTLSLPTNGYSAQGSIYFRQDTIFYFDKMYRTVSAYARDGTLSYQKLGPGDGPDQMLRFICYSPYLDAQHMLVSDYAVSFYSPSWVLRSRLGIDWNDNTSISKLSSSPHPEMTGIYEMAWGRTLDGDAVIWDGGQFLYFPIESSHPKFNGYMPSEYYVEGRTLARLDLNTGKIVSLHGKRSEVYLLNKYLGNFDFQSTTFDGDNIFVNFAVDPLIYVLDENMEIAYAFGCRPHEINDHYRTYSTFEEADGMWSVDMEEFGFYHHLYVDKLRGLVFRKVQIGKGAKYGMLQMYHNKVLIGEFRVPKQFKLIGQDDKFYYADGYMDENLSLLGVYRVKFPGLIGTPPMP